MDRKPLSLRCDPEQYSTLLWPPAMCNHPASGRSWPVVFLLCAVPSVSRQIHSGFIKQNVRLQSAWRSSTFVAPREHTKE